MIGIIGLILAIAAVIFLIWRGWHMAIVSIVGAVIIIAFNGMDLFSALTTNFMGDMSAFVGKWFLLFSLGSVFGRIMGDSGASTGIANSMLKAIGEKYALLVLMITGIVLSYGGISTFIIAFSIYPIAVALFEKADIPKKLIVAAIMVCPVTLGMVMMPGLPSTQNLLPTTYLGTDAYAGATLGLICSAIMFVSAYLYLQHQIKKCKANGEHFVKHPDETIRDLSEGEGSIPVWQCYAPIVALVALVFVFQKVTSMSATDAVTIAMLIAIVLGCALYRNQLGDAKKAICEATGAGLNSLISVASIMGFGGVVVASSAYQTIIEILVNSSINPLGQAYITICIIAGITGSAIGALNIFFNNMAASVLATGLNPAMIHRVLCMATVGPATAMPHTSAMLACNQVARTELRDTYRYVLVCCSIMPFCVSLIGLCLGLLGIV